MNFRIHQEAAEEAVEGATWYENNKPGLGKSFTQIVDDVLRQIQHSPERFAKLETTQLTGEIRRALLLKFPYLIVYEIRANCVEVLAVTHASRAPDYWMERRAGE